MASFTSALMCIKVTLLELERIQVINHSLMTRVKMVVV